MTRNPRALLLITSVMISSLCAEMPVIKAVNERMESYVEAKEIAGAVTLVADSEKILHLSATGLADLGTNRPMATDSVFWIA